MSIGDTINKLRNSAGLSQEQFARLFDISQQSVQKWESNESTPELSKLIKISKHFGISLDALILGKDVRIAEEMEKTKVIKPQYSNLAQWEFYSDDILTEYTQSLEEGKDIEPYFDLFSAVSRLPRGEFKKKFGDVLFEMTYAAKQRADYKYNEPSELEAVKMLRSQYAYKKNQTTDLSEKIRGAWYGRVSGCMLGKTVECIKTSELIPFLKSTNNYPMHRYIYSTDVNEEIYNKYNFPFKTRQYADTIDFMPGDDDTTYTVIYQRIIETYGRDFTPQNVADSWLNYQYKNCYCTAERVAYCNFIKGYTPPVSAIYQNPYREWIGAQIRADYFGYINPGKPEAAAELAWKDACISHVKNGIYGEMFVAAMLAVAADTDNIKDIILGGLAEIPTTSRLYEAISNLIESYDNGLSQEDCFENIHTVYDENSPHDWCHTISNAMIVVASLLYGQGDFGKSICMAVETGFDTDCNGATIGSILGMANGIKSIPEYWIKPFNGIIETSITGVNNVSIDECINLTLKHIDNQ